MPRKSISYEQMDGFGSPSVQGSSGSGIFSTLLADASSWCHGRTWWFRLPLWAYLTYVFFSHSFASGEYESIFGGINLGIHELGHGLFRPGGEFLMYAGGTIAQCLAPIIAGFMFLKQRDYFGLTVSWCWLATNFWNISSYAGDARALRLTLVAPGTGVIPPGEGASMHDWRYMLGQLGILPWDKTIAGFFEWAAAGMMVFALSLGAWLMWNMATSPKK